MLSSRAISSARELAAGAAFGAAPPGAGAPPRPAPPRPPPAPPANPRRPAPRPAESPAARPDCAGRALSDRDGAAAFATAPDAAVCAGSFAEDAEGDAEGDAAVC